MENELILQLGEERRGFLIVRHENSGLGPKAKLDHFPFITAVGLCKQTNQDQITQFELLSEWNSVPVLNRSSGKKISWVVSKGILEWTGLLPLSFNGTEISSHTSPKWPQNLLIKRVQILNFPSNIPPKLCGSFDC